MYYILNHKVDLWRAMIPSLATNPFTLAVMSQNHKFDSVQYWTWAAGRKYHFSEKVLQNQYHNYAILLFLPKWSCYLGTGMVHGDFNFCNLGFDPKSSKVKAVLDWEMACVGDVCCDLAVFFYVLPQAQWVQFLLAATSLRVCCIFPISHVDICTYSPVCSCAWIWVYILHDILVCWVCSIKNACYCIVTGY